MIKFSTFHKINNWLCNIEIKLCHLAAHVTKQHISPSAKCHEFQIEQAAANIYVITLSGSSWEMGFWNFEYRKYCAVNGCSKILIFPLFGDHIISLYWSDIVHISKCILLAGKIWVDLQRSYIWLRFTPPHPSLGSPAHFIVHPDAFPNLP